MLPASMKHASRPRQVAYFAGREQTSRPSGYGVYMHRRKAPVKDNFRRNLETLLNQFGWSNRELSRRTNGEVSDRYIGMLRAGDYVPTIEMAESIGQAFGLDGWHMIRPNLVYELAKSGQLDRLLDGYCESERKARDYIDSIIEREAQSR